MGTARRVVLLGATLAWFVLFSQTSGAQWDRQDPPGDYYLVGYLRWNDGVGRIGWSPDVESQDPGGPRGAVGSVEFTSDPVPFRLFVNASRQLEVDLLSPVSSESTGDSCTADGQTRVVLRNAGALVGGRLGDAKFYGVQFEPSPPGYSTCRFRFGAEVSTIDEQGSLVLTIDLPDERPFKRGMTEPHASVVRIPYFGPDEIPFRYPSAVPGRGLDSKPTGFAADFLDSLGGIASAGIAVSRRKTGIPLLVLAIVLSGCFSSQSVTIEGNSGATLTQATIQPQYLENQDPRVRNGTLLGIVFDAANLRPIDSAHVALLKTPLSTLTSGGGRFVFRDLAPGNQRVRIDKEGFQPFEQDVIVKENVITRVDVPLQPVAGSDSERAHRHDYWGGRTSIRVADHEPIGEGGNVRYVLPSLPNGTDTILPGTYTTRVTLHTENPGPWELRLQANNDAAPLNRSKYLPRRPGESFNVSTAWEMQDPGHQRFSSWAFVFSGGICGVPQHVLDARRPCFVTIDIEKGEVPFEPAHPDFWKASNERVAMANARLRFSASSSVVPPTYESTAPAFPDLTIPPGTTELRVTWQRTFDSPAAYVLGYKTAEVQTAATCAPGASTGNCRGPDFRYLDPSSAVGNLFEWRFASDDFRNDPYYAVRSFWVFTISPKTLTDEVLQMPSAKDRPDSAAGTLSVTAIHST